MQGEFPVNKGSLERAHPLTAKTALLRSFVREGIARNTEGLTWIFEDAPVAAMM